MARIVKDITAGALNLLVRFRTEWDDEWATADTWIAPSPDATYKLRVRFDGGTLEVQFKLKDRDGHSADWTRIYLVTPEKSPLEVELEPVSGLRARTHWDNGVVDTEFRQRLKGRGDEGWVAMKGIFVGKLGSSRPGLSIATGTSGVDYEAQIRHCRNKNGREEYSDWSPITTVRTRHDHTIGFAPTNKE